jgi:hypothetical protein
MAARFDNLRNVQLIQHNDQDIYAVGSRGEILQKKVSFHASGQLKSVEWVPFEGGGYCQAPSEQFLTDIEEHGNDPRLAMSDPEVRRKWGGNPDERLR